MGFAEGHLIPLADEGLGNSAYLVDLGDGRALAVDAGRDLRAAAARRCRLTVAYAADTHLHADFLSGAVQLAHDAGATMPASAAGQRAFPHRALADGDEADLGGLRLRALATPGHTDEHLSFLLLDDGRELGVFTGGSLIVDSAARPDLLGAERTTTIGAQKRTNPLLAAPDEDTFVRRLVASLGSYPAYFARLTEHNRRGPAVLTGTPPLPALNAERVRALLADGGQVVDVRPAAEYAAAHGLGLDTADGGAP